MGVQYLPRRKDTNYRRVNNTVLLKMKTQIAFLLFALLVAVSGKALQNDADIQATKVSDALAAQDALDSGNESGEDALDSVDNEDDEADEDDEDEMMAADPEPASIFDLLHFRNRFRHKHSEDDEDDEDEMMAADPEPASIFYLLRFRLGLG